MTHCGRFLQAPYLPVGYLTLGMFGRLRRWLLLTVMSSVCWYILSTRRSRSGIARSEDSVATASPTREHLLTSYYVTLCRNRFRDSHRTGNYLFFLAGLLYAAQLTGRTVSVPKHRWPLDEIFQMDGLHRYRARPICPCHELAHPPPVSYHGDANLDSARGRAALRRDRNRTVALCRLYQTYRYADAVAPALRQLLRFRVEVLDAARQVLDDGRPESWTSGSYVRVGLHVRRGDFLHQHWVMYGLTVVDRRFVNHAVDYFTSKFARVQLVVASDDPRWIGDVLLEKFTRASVRSTSRFMPLKPRPSTSKTIPPTKGLPPNRSYLISRY